MSERFVAIRLKVPDNEAYTALTTLQRLGVNIARIQRSRIIQCHPELVEGRTGTTPVILSLSKDALAAAIERDESIFNPNIHALEILDRSTPREGELWIESLEPTATTANARTAWRLYNADDKPADRATLQAAAERLLCNPAIERARFA